MSQVQVGLVGRTPAVEVPASATDTSLSSRPGFRPIPILAEALRCQLELSRQRDALGVTRGTSALGRETGCRC